MDWQVTASTLPCDIVDDWVTIMVYPDGAVKCNHFNRIGPVTRKVQAQKDKSAEIFECKGPDCATAQDYKEKIFQQDSGIAQSAKA